LFTKECIEQGKMDVKTLQKSFAYRDESIDRLFQAMQRVVDCERIIRK
jgi:hypothetical protein